jgi:hypothetical protein
MFRLEKQTYLSTHLKAQGPSPAVGGLLRGHLRVGIWIGTHRAGQANEQLAVSAAFCSFSQVAINKRLEVEVKL